MKNILVPTNFSKNCIKATQLGIEIAKLYNSEIHFLHSINTPVDWVKLNKLNEKRYPETLKQIGIAKAALRALEKNAESQKLKCRTYLQYNSGEKDVLEHSTNFNHDFIITASSVEEIVRKAKVPVIVVKDKEVTFPFKNIVFVSDFKEDVTEAFKQVISIANKCDSHIHLLCINTHTDFNNIALGLKPIEELLEKFPAIKNYSMAIYNEPSVETGINTFTKQQPIDLIAMITHGKTGFLSLFSKSISKEVASHSTLPVMTIHV